MRTKDYIYYLTPDDRKRFHLEMDRGRVIGFVVQYETLVGERWRPVIRYDTAHGYPHIDILNQRGRVVEKVELTHMDYKDALNFADYDVSSNWEAYKQKFFKGRIK